MNPVSLGDSVYLTFGTSSASTGAATNADSTPSVSVREDGVDMGLSPTVTNITTGLYQAQIDATAGNGFEAGKRYAVSVTATVGGVTGRDGIGEFEVLATDLNAGVASVQGNVTGNVAGSVASVSGNVAGSVASVVGAVGSVTAAVTVGTNNDKTGYALSAASVQAVWDYIVTGSTTAVQAMRGFIAAMMGKASGLNVNAPKYRNIADTKDVISATTDASGNRTNVTLDLT